MRTVLASSHQCAYHRTAIVLHWSLAVLLPGLIGLGWYMLSVEDQPGTEWLFALHISLGLTAAAFIVIRVVWRIGHSPPALPASVGIWYARAARLSHLVVYCLLIAIPATGYLGASFSSRAPALWGLALPAWATKSEAFKDQFFQLHSFAAWSLAFMVALHVLAALKHLLVDKDRVFQRMWLVDFRENPTPLS